MTQFEALYGRMYRYHISRFEAREFVFIGSELVHESIEKRFKLFMKAEKWIEVKKNSYADVIKRALI